jgi:hypothetical protein
MTIVLYLPQQISNHGFAYCLLFFLLIGKQIFTDYVFSHFVVFQLNPWPEYINTRLDMYNKLKAEHDSILAEKAEKDSRPIKVTLPDGKQVDADSWKTTPYQIACGTRYELRLYDYYIVCNITKLSFIVLPGFIFIIFLCYYSISHAKNVKNEGMSSHMES